MFSWFTRHVAYLLFWRRQPSGFRKEKGTRIMYISGRQQNFLSGIFVGLHCLSFLRLIYPFSDSLVCNSVYRASFLFRTKGIYFISFHGQDMERTGKESYVSLSFSLRSLPSSFAVAWNIKFPTGVCRLRPSFQEITSLFYRKRQRKKNLDESCLND